jgi:hypothetical protein
LKRSEVPPYKTATYVLPRWKTVYVSVPKAACTSMKWLVADLQDESPERFYKAVSRETGRNMTVHHRDRWRHTPMLPQLSDAELEEITPDNGWFVFAVVRHPAARLWSGWQSKFLLQEPRFRDLHPEAPWPRVPGSTSDVVEDFTTFVRYLDTTPDAPVFKDRHFRTQSHLLRPGLTPYTRIYQTGEMPVLLEDLATHLRPLGRESLPPLRRSNETPLRPLRSMFSPDVDRVVRRHYAADLAEFDYPDSIPGGLHDGEEYSPELLAEVGRLVERAERIGDLYQATMRARRAARRAEAEVRELRAQAAHRPPGVRPLAVRALHRAASRLRSR